jgi:hypothetical protein
MEKREPDMLEPPIARIKARPGNRVSAGFLAELGPSSAQRSYGTPSQLVGEHGGTFSERT